MSVGYGTLPEVAVEKPVEDTRRSEIRTSSVFLLAVFVFALTVAVVGKLSLEKSTATDFDGSSSLLSQHEDRSDFREEDEDDAYSLMETLSTSPGKYYQLGEDSFPRKKEELDGEIFSFSYDNFAETSKPGMADYGQGRLVHPNADIDSSYAPSDPLATDLTKQLFQSLRDVSLADSFLFGHQNDAAKGQKFRDPSATHHLSDVNIATNGSEWAAVYGFNLWEVFNGSTLIHFVKSAYMKGAVIEMEWEADNPITGNSASDCTGNPMNHILPGGSLNEVWNEQLDVIVSEISEYVVDGIQIPVVLRLFHENTGTWYWWGTSCANTTAYVAGFQYTVDYLRDAGLHNLLIVYAPSKPSRYKTTVFSELYPGNDYVDVVAFDRYGLVEYGIDIVDDAAIVIPFAHTNRKVPALAETGFYKGSYNIGLEYLVNDSSWWTDAFLKPIVEDGNASQIAYAITWTNYARDCYWIPLEGDYTYDGFVHMAHSPEVLFIDDTRWVNLPYSHSIQLARKEDGWSRRLESDENNIPDVEDLARDSNHSSKHHKHSSKSNSTEHSSKHNSTGETEKHYESKSNSTEKNGKHHESKSNSTEKNGNSNDHDHKHHRHSSKSNSTEKTGKSYDHGYWRCSMPSDSGT